jgi:hypothetical protein
LYRKKSYSKLLVGAPYHLKETFKNYSSFLQRFPEKKRQNQFNYIDMIEEMDPKSCKYHVYSFNAMQNGAPKMTRKPRTIIPNHLAAQ